MATFLFTTLPSNDLGLLTRSLPVARELAALGHRVVFCSPGRAPRRLIADAGFESRVPDDPLYNLSDAASLGRLLRPSRWRSVPVAFRTLRQVLRAGTAEVWTLDHFLALMGLGDADLVRAAVDSVVRLIGEVRPDAVVDFWNPIACIAARATGTPLATVIQADIHPHSRGFIWWRDPPADVPTPVPGVNRALAGLGLPPVARAAELLLGDVTLAVGIPETDPLPPRAAVTHVGAILWEQPGSTLPDWVTRADPERPLVWVYSGNPAYMPGMSTPFDSRVVLEACIDALRTEPVRVVLTTGHQPLPRQFRRLPANFRHVPYLPGLALAEHSAVLVHHGGYGSCQTGLWAGRPAVVIPTYSERESNARRIAAAGAGLVVLPESDARGRHKRVPAEALRAAVRAALDVPAYAREAARLSRALRAAGGARLAARLIAEATAPSEPAALT
jgi:UDP:flavonoid glycosyltransferase YjiC (YdhE family)